MLTFKNFCQRVNKEMEQQEQHACAQVQALDGVKAKLAAELERVAELETQLQHVTSGDAAQAALVHSLQVSSVSE